MYMPNKAQMTPTAITAAIALINRNVCIPSGDANHAPIFFSKPFFSFACCVLMFCCFSISIYSFLLIYTHFTIPIHYNIAISKLQQLKSTNIFLHDVRCSQLIYPMLQRVCKLLLKKGRQRVIIFMYFKKHKEKR